MSCLLRIFFICAFLLTLYSSVESKNFCEAFRQNKDKINYMFRQPIQSSTFPNTFYEIIINGFYWRLTLNQENGLNLVLNENESQSSLPLFSSDYVIAITLKPDDSPDDWFIQSDWSKELPILFPAKNWKNITVGQISGDDYTNWKPLKDYIQKASVGITGLNEEEPPLFAFSEEYHHNRIINRIQFFRKLSTGSLDPKCYEMSYDSKAHRLKANLIESCSQTNGIKALKSEQINALLTIGSQWKESLQKTGHLFLFNDNQIIKWCWTQAEALDPMCNKPQQLVNCTSEKTKKDGGPDGGPDEVPDDGYNKYIWFVIILGVVFIIIIFTGVIVYLCRGQRNDTKTETATSVASNMKTKTSAVSQGSKVSGTDLNPPTTFSGNFKLKKSNVSPKK